MKSYLPVCVALLFSVLLAGCAGVDARREQRWAAFDPLRPDPQFRLLPDRPLLKFNRSDAADRDRSEEDSSMSAAPLVWKSTALDSRDLLWGASRFHPAGFELYVIAGEAFDGRLRARALNERREEVGRAEVSLVRKADEAGWVSFRFPGRFAPGEVKVIAVELAE